MGAEIRRLAGAPVPPLAIVGSGNTALTLELAAALRDSSKSLEGRQRSPVLLIPWATTVQAQNGDASSGQTPLLEIDAGAAFRFCPNNQQLADLVARCVTAHESGVLPRRVVMVVDSHDPYSVDLAGCFAKSIRSLAPLAQIETQSDPEPYPGLTEIPGQRERHWAEELWQQAHRETGGQVTWVVLPLAGRAG